MDESGRVSAAGVGNCNITGTANDGSGVKVRIRVSVKNYDVVLTTAGESGASLFDGNVTVSGRQMTGDFDETKVVFKNGCAAVRGGTLTPLKAGEDTVTVTYKVDGKEKRGTFTLYGAQDAVTAGGI